MPTHQQTEAEARALERLQDGRPAPVTFGTGSWYVSGEHDVAHADDLQRGYFCWAEWCHPDGLWMPPDKWLIGKTTQRVRPGRWYAVVTWPENSTHTTRTPLDHLLQGEPMRTATTARTAADFPADTFLSGYCNGSNDDASHARCRGVYPRPGGKGAITCRCFRESCDCYKLTRPDAAAVESLQQAVTEVQQAAGVTRRYDPVLDAAAPGWTADEVADLMVELDACPLCSVGWADHVFTDDDRVVCP